MRILSMEEMSLIVGGGALDARDDGAGGTRGGTGSSKGAVIVERVQEWGQMTDIVLINRLRPRSRRETILVLKIHLLEK